MVKHEAMAIRASRLRLLGGGDAQLDAREAVELPGPWSGRPTASGPTARWPPWRP